MWAMAQAQNYARNSGERGQTIILVAVCVVSLLAMAALAVDIVTLYVAKGEIQRAADAAALAGAKAFVESTVTTDPANVTLQGIAKTIACPDAACSSGYIADALKQNPVSGSQAIIDATKPVSFDFTNHLGNPRITVNLQRTGLPIFFARIWSSTLASVSATATAEAYNASNSQNNYGALIPIAPQCVKPILVRNKTHGVTAPVPQFINTNDGTVHVLGTFNSGGLIGREFTLSFSSCAGISSCVRYRPAVASPPHNFCSSCAGSTDYEQSIGCCDGSVDDVLQCGDSAAISAQVKQPFNPTALTESAMQCAIHASGPGPGNGQDGLNTTNFLASGDPMQIQAGTYNQSQLGVAANAPITTSDSVMTLPIYDDCVGGGCVPTPPALPAVNIVGFLQVFVNSTNPPAGGDLDVTILNVIGCGSNPPSAVPAISGGGISPIPVRLITPGG
jgi:Putative Flp pilus-assembly TadE/G-like